MLKWSILFFLFTSCSYLKTESSSSIYKNQRRVSSEDFEIPVHSQFGIFFENAKFKSQATMGELEFAKKNNISSKITKKILDRPTLQASIQDQAPWSIELVNDTKGSGYQFGNYILSIDFGKISRSQFELLKKRFKQDNLIYQQDKKYGLVDFLPKVAKALYGKYYIHNRYTFSETQIPWHYKFKDITNEGQVSRITNCWNAVWNYLQEDQEMASVFFADEFHIKKIFEDSAKSEIILNASGNQAYNAYKNPETFYKDALPGDVILIYQKSYSMAMGEHEILAHSAVFLDNNLVFEKQNPLSSLPYRISFLTDSLDGLIMYEKNSPEEKTQEKDLASIRIVVRRFKKPLPNIKTLINAGMKPGTFVNFNELEASQRPPNSFLESHTIVTEFGSGGNVISEDLYKIEEYPISQISE